MAVASEDELAHASRPFADLAVHLERDHGPLGAPVALVLFGVRWHYIAAFDSLLHPIT